MPSTGFYEALENDGIEATFVADSAVSVIMTKNQSVSICHKHLKPTRQHYQQTHLQSRCNSFISGSTKANGFRECVLGLSVSFLSLLVLCCVCVTPSYQHPKGLASPPTNLLRPPLKTRG